MIGNSGIDQDVQAKMNAYRGNPNALAQQYQQGQQLIDLLALQKLKSEKESAAREMQLKMGGGQKPTVGQQLESEVLDLTKQELAQNTAGSMQTKQNQEQQAAKQLVQRTAQMPMQSPSPMTQGVAGLQAPNMSAKAMATGGIVAFEKGGPAEDDPQTQADREALLATGRYVLDALGNIVDAPLRAVGTVSDFFINRPLRAAGLPIPRVPAQNRYGAEAPKAPTAGETIGPQGMQELPSTPAPAPSGGAPSGGAPSGGAPSGGAPSGGPSGGIAGLDPRAMAIRDQYQSYVGLNPEELALRKGNRADRENFDKERYSPEQQQREALTRFFLGGAGRSGIGSIMAGAGAASENYKSGMRNADRARMVDRQKLDDEATKTDVGIRKFSFDTGIKTATDYAQIAVQQASNALRRGEMNQREAFTALGTLEGRFNDSVKIADTNYNNKLKSIGIFPGQQPTPAQQRQLEIAQTERQQDILGAQQRLGPLIQQASIKAGIPSAGAANGFSLQSVTPTPTR